MKKIGIFLGFAPGQSIKNQGIGRLLGFILSGILQNGCEKIIIAAPLWYKPKINELLADLQLDYHQIELLLTKKVPIIVRIGQFLSNFKKKQRRGRILHLIYNSFKKIKITAVKPFNFGKFDKTSSCNFAYIV